MPILASTFAASRNRFYFPPILIRIALGPAFRQAQVEQGCHTYCMSVTEVFPMDFAQLAVANMLFLAAPVAVQQVKAKASSIMIGKSSMTI
jgi:negative regulator of sigma E activity